MYRYVPIIFLRVLYVGAGCPVGSYFLGSGCSSAETPRFNVLGHKPNVTWFKALCAGGGNVTFVG